MRHPLLALPPRAPGGALHVVVDTPRGSPAKLKLDEARGVFVLGRVLPAGLAFPFDFGFVPGTCSADGDPEDVVLLSDGPLFPGVLVEARLIGVIEAEKRTDDAPPVRKDRLIAAAEVSRTWGALRTLDELPRALVDDVEHFLVSYNEGLGRHFDLLGRAGPDRARELLDASIARADGRR